MDDLSPVCATCMGLLDVWVVYDGGLLVHDDPECRRYADNKPKSTAAAVSRCGGA